MLNLKRLRESYSMKLSSKLVIILAFAIFIAIPQQDVLAYSGSSGQINIEPDEWWYYPMVIESGELLECSFHTDYGIVEYFIVHEDYYVENTEISEQVLIHHNIGSSDDFQVTLPSEGGWYWVFINNGANTIRLNYRYESDFSNNVLIPFNLVLATVVLAAILGLAGVLHFRNKGKQASIT